MRGNRRTLFQTTLLLAMGTMWLGCAEVQQIAEEHARRSGDERLAKIIHGGGTLIAGLLPIGYDEEQSLGAAIALQVVARHGGVYDQPELTRYVNLVGRAVALTCDRPATSS